MGNLPGTSSDMAMWGGQIPETEFTSNKVARLWVYDPEHSPGIPDQGLQKDISAKHNFWRPIAGQFVCVCVRVSPGFLADLALTTGYLFCSFERTSAPRLGTLVAFLLLLVSRMRDSRHGAMFERPRRLLKLGILRSSLFALTQKRFQKTHDNPFIFDGCNYRIPREQARPTGVLATLKGCLSREPPFPLAEFWGTGQGDSGEGRDTTHRL